MLVIKDFATTTLAEAVTAEATTITVANAGLLPVLTNGDYFYLVLQNFVDRTYVEIVKVTATVGNVLTVARAQDGTTAKTFAIGDYAELRLTVGVFDEYVVQSTAGKVDEVGGYVSQGLDFLNEGDDVRASVSVVYDVAAGHGTIVSGAEGTNKVTPYVALRPLGKADSTIQAKYGVDGSLSLVGGTRSFFAGLLSSEYVADANGWPVNTAGNANNYINRARTKFTAGDNGLFVFGDGAAGTRRFGMQVSHKDAANSTQYGTLELNPYGGAVKVNGGTVYHTGNKPTADDVAALPIIGGTLTGKTWFTGSETGINIGGGVGAAGTQGDLRFNTALLEFEGYANNEWKPVGGGGSVTWTVVTGDTAAQVGKGYLVNAPGITITLPANPAAGKTVGVGDYNGQNYPVTVARNGKPIMGSTEDFVFDVKNSNVVFAFIDNNVGWVLTQGFGESSVPKAIANISAPAVTVGQTVFSFPNFGTDSVDVYYNGKKLLRGSDYTANNTANTVTLLEPVTFADDIVELYNWNQAAVVQANKISYDSTASKVPATTMQTAIDYAIQQPSGMKNRIINGKMEIAQRGNSFPSAPSGCFGVDRFKYETNITSAATIVSKEADAPAEFKSSLRIEVTTADTSMAASEYVMVGQIIEGFNITDLIGKPFTLSFWVRSSKPGIYSAAFRNKAANASYVSEYTINQANTWEFKEITVASGLDITAAWEATTDIGLRVQFVLACGSTFKTGTINSWTVGNYFASANQVNAADTVGTIFAITGVQLEAGEVATPFEHRLYGQELALCQRYCVTVGLDGNSSLVIGGYCNGSTALVTYYPPVQLRADPTWVGGVLSIASAAGIANVTSIKLSGNTILCSASQSNTAGHSAYLNASTNTGFRGFVAEL